VSTQEEASSLTVRGDTLEQRQSIADTVRGSCGELRGVQQGVDGDDLL
jgi:hypothetical protein